MYNPRNELVGVYTPNTQFILSPETLAKLGFSQQEVETLTYITQFDSHISPQKLYQLGMDYEYAKRIKYLHDIAVGKVSIESKEDYVKHLRRLFGKHRRISIFDLTTSKLKEVPRFAVVAKIKDETYATLNSAAHKGKEGIYTVTDATKKSITIQFPHELVIKYNYPKEIKNVLEIKGKEGKNTLVSINKDYAKLCNRYIIVASLKKPEFHCGMLEIICIEGTSVYVYAKDVGTKKTIDYGGGTLRVYDYGYNVNEIRPRILRVSEEIYKKLCGTYATYIAANTDFTLIPNDMQTNDLEIEE